MTMNVIDNATSWFDNHHKQGGEIGLFNYNKFMQKVGMDHLSPEYEKAKNTLLEVVAKNKNLLKISEDEFIKDIPHYSQFSIEYRFRSAVQMYWMYANYDKIKYRSICFGGKDKLNDKYQLTIHPGRSRLMARVTHGLDSRCIFIDYGPNLRYFTDSEMKNYFSPFTDAKQMLDNLTYSGEIPNTFDIHPIDEDITITNLFGEEIKQTKFQHMDFKDGIFSNLNIFDWHAFIPQAVQMAQEDSLIWQNK